jgi:23S rRNA-/tRNA-specific pseudouridylate synthase
MPNRYTFEYGDEIRALLHRFTTDEAAVDTRLQSSTSGPALVATDKKTHRVC